MVFSELHDRFSQMRHEKITQPPEPKYSAPPVCPVRSVLTTKKSRTYEELSTALKSFESLQIDIVPHVKHNVMSFILALVPIPEDQLNFVIYVQTNQCKFQAY